MYYIILFYFIHQFLESNIGSCFCFDIVGLFRVASKVPHQNSKNGHIENLEGSLRILHQRFDIKSQCIPYSQV